MAKYTVLVKYPDRLFDPDALYYSAQVEADNPVKAIDKGEREAWSRQPSRDRGHLVEWVFVAVYAGHPTLEVIK